MQLTYRGTHHNYELNSAEMIDSGLTGSYRGHSFPVTYPRHIPAPQTLKELTYRGVSYRLNQADGRPVAKTERPAAAPAPVTLATFKKARVTEYAQMHQLHIQQRLQHRIEVARAKGDAKLVSLLEREMQQAG
jgi:hypothetical protein